VKNQYQIIVLCLCLTALGTPGFSATLITKLRLGPTPQRPVINPVTRRLYVPDWQTNAVDVVDTSTNTLLAAIPLPISRSFETYTLDVNPVTNLIYVMTGDTFYANAVYVINGADNSVVTSIPIGVGADGVAVNSVTNRIYACSFVDGTVSVIDGSANTIIDTITPPKNAQWVAVDATTNFVYVTSANGRPSESTLYVYDGTTDTLIHTVALSGGSSAQGNGLSVDPSVQRAYVTNTAFGTLDVIDTTTFTLTGRVTGLHSPQGPNINPVDHTVLVPNTPDDIHHNVATVDTGTLAITGRIGTPGLVEGVAVDPATGDLYMTVNGLAVFAP
jgi:DNA-binding beta-propeller fold protein YncE